MRVAVGFRDEPEALAAVVPAAAAEARAGDPRAVVQRVDELDRAGVGDGVDPAILEVGARRKEQRARSVVGPAEDLDGGRRAAVVADAEELHGARRERHERDASAVLVVADLRATGDVFGVAALGDVVRNARRERARVGNGRRDQHGAPVRRHHERRDALARHEIQRANAQRVPRILLGAADAVVVGAIADDVEQLALLSLEHAALARVDARRRR